MVPAQSKINKDYVRRMTSHTCFPIKLIKRVVIVEVLVLSVQFSVNDWYCVLMYVGVTFHWIFFQKKKITSKVIHTNITSPQLRKCSDSFSYQKTRSSVDSTIPSAWWMMTKIIIHPTNPTHDRRLWDLDPCNPQRIVTYEMTRQD